MAIWDFDYSSVSSIARLLEENGLGMSRKFGQNFLINMTALDRIAGLCGAKEGMKVWEVGPGIGALTTRLIGSGAHVTSFEIDHGFCRILREQAYIDVPNFTLVEGDVLKTWKDVYGSEGRPDIVCSNLPYNIGSVFIASLIEGRCLPDIMVLTLQSEVVSRICAKIGDDDYSGFSVLTGIDYDSMEVFRLKGGSFYPAPNVDSSVVVMRRRETPMVPEHEAARFMNLVKVLFSQRRKTVRNNLKALGKSGEAIDSALLKSGISRTERAESLTVRQMLELSRNMG